MRADLWHQSLRLGLAAGITASIALWSQRIEFVWYPLLAVIFVIDDNDERTLASARARLLGTATGGLVAFLVHTIASGWGAVLLSLLITVPLLRLLGWHQGLSTAVTITILFLLIPGYTALNWDYVFNRTLDTSVGIGIALLCGLGLWPRDRLERITGLDRELRAAIAHQDQAWMDWRQGRRDGAASAPPGPLPPARLSTDLLELERLVQAERAHRGGTVVRRQRWDQRLLLWRTIKHHWVQYERLMTLQAALPEGSPIPLLLRQSIEEEESRLRHALHSQRLCEGHPRGRGAP